jgi:hypothetical protein
MNFAFVSQPLKTISCHQYFGNSTHYSQDELVFETALAIKQPVSGLF